MHSPQMSNDCRIGSRSHGVDANQCGSQSPRIAALNVSTIVRGDDARETSGLRFLVPRSQQICNVENQMQNLMHEGVTKAEAEAIGSEAASSA